LNTYKEVNEDKARLFRGVWQEDERQWAGTETREAPAAYGRNFFATKTVKQWSGLAREFVQSSCLEVFKTQL